MRSSDMVTLPEGFDKHPNAVIIVDGMSSHKQCAADGCNRFVPDERRFDAIYCSRRCATRTHARRLRAKKEASK